MARKPKTLVVDADEGVRTFLTEALASFGHAAATARTADDALKTLGADRFDLVLAEIFLPGTSGIELAKQARAAAADLPVILMARDAPVRTVVAGMRAGAVDCIEKPIDIDRLRIAVENALGHVRLERENAALRRRGAGDVPDIIGGSQLMRGLVAMCDRIAPTDLTVLIEGESGVGKELVASRLHAKSPRAGMPFIAVNCGAVQQGLLESELFGHERGAFTGAVAERAGLFEIADRGTLFLDEIGETPVDLQVKLLRILETGEFRRVGGERTTRVDVRVIAATNRRLADEVRKGAFREDLYYRLNVILIEVPPLRRRIEDLPAMVDSFVESARRRGLRPKRFTPEAIEALKQHAWPGNVRELQNVVERALILSRGDEIDADELPDLPRAGLRGEDGGGDSSQMTLFDLERRHILRTLRANGGNKVRTARKLGINVKTLYNKLKGYETETADSTAGS